MGKMAPENVATSCSLKLDARREAQRAQFYVWSKSFNLKGVLNVKQRCSFFFSFKSKLSGFRARRFNNCIVSWVFFTPERLLETSVLGLFLFAIIKII